MVVTYIIMDELTKQKIPIIIKQHILQTKIGYLVEKMSLEKRKCKKADDAFSSILTPPPAPDEVRKDMVLIRRTSTDYTGKSNQVVMDTNVVNRREGDGFFSITNI